MIPPSMSTRGLPVMIRRAASDLLVKREMHTATTAYTAMANSEFSGVSSSVAISAAMEPMVMPMI